MCLVRLALALRGGAGRRLACGLREHVGHRRLAADRHDADIQLLRGHGVVGLRQARELAEVKVRDDLGCGRQARPARDLGLSIKRRVVPGAERRHHTTAHDGRCAMHAELVAQRVDGVELAQGVGPGLAARHPHIMIARHEGHFREGALAQL